MPLIDMPLAELKQYKGINPKPADFDTFWADALNEMRSCDPQVELVPADFKAPFADCFDMYFTGVRGARIHAKYVRPKNAAAPHPAVIQFHGYSGNAGEWYNKLGFAAAGFSVVAMDCRGQGGSSEDTGGVKGNTLRGHIIRGIDDKPENLLFRHIFLDTAQLADITMSLPEVDATRVGVMGGSQGGGLALACIGLEPRVKLAAPVYPFLCDYRRVWEMDLAKNAYEELKIYFKFFDPLHKREEEIFTKLGYIDVQHLAERIKSEVLMTVGLMDEVCPPSAQFAAYNKIRSKKDLVIYPDFGHEFMIGLDDIIFSYFMGL